MKKTFASRLHRLREKSSLSQKELAIALKVTPATLSNYENGIYLPPLPKASILAKQLDTSLDYLCGLTDMNFDIALLSKPVTSNLTFYELARLLAAFSSQEREELLVYSDFLNYKRQHKEYREMPQIYQVAEEET